MLTTKDNPYNPWSQFDQWYTWDLTRGYDTLAYLGRIVVTSDELSAADQSLAIEQAIDEIITQNGNTYQKVARPPATPADAIS
jgi:hypothetical protein